MSPDPPGVATPREPGADKREPTSAHFRGRVEQVDETTPGPVRPRPTSPARAAAKAGGTGGRSRVRARKVHRIVRHVDPWSVLKISLLFFLALFMILCVASAVLWNAASGAGVVDNVESFITDVGGFGNCPTPLVVDTPAVDPAVSSTTSTPVAQDTTSQQDCPDGQALQGTFKFEDGKIFEAFALGGVVLVLAGSAGAVVVALLFNLMSDLTGGVRVTVLEEEPIRTGSPAPRSRD